MLVWTRSARPLAAGDAALIATIGVGDPELEGTGVVVVTVELRATDYRRVEAREGDLIACSRIGDIRALRDESNVAIVYPGGTACGDRAEHCERSTIDYWFCFHVGPLLV